MRTFGFSLFIAAAISFGLTGCTSANQPAASVAATDGDPANGNLAPADSSAAQVTPVSQTSPLPQSSSNYNPAPPPPAYSAQSDQGYSDQGYTDQASGDQAIYASAPPPELPEYSQPPCPGDNYLWTPGYWSYTAAGYYFVPGVWVVAPYVGALWTPPYWDFYENRYRWHGGYWGTHIGFYGGVNYGFGYVGRGYYGGYWHGSDFTYNRAVTNVNVNVVRNTNVYNYRVTNVTNNRVSYNGGPGGLNVRPTAPEIAAVHERRMAPVAAQVAQVRQAETNHAQFASVNHGRPAEAAVQRPLQTEYRTPAAQPSAVPGSPRVFAPTARPEPGRIEPGRSAAPQNEMRAQAHPQPAQAAPARQEARQEGRPEGRQEPFRPVAQAAQPMRQPEPAARAEPMRPAPAPRQEPMRAAPAPRQEPMRPAPAPRQEVARPAPAPRVEMPRPAPHVEAARPAPAPRAEAPRPAPRAEPARPAPAPHAEPPHAAPAPRAEPQKPEKHP